MTPSTRFVVEYARMQIDGVPNMPESARPTDDSHVPVYTQRHRSVRPCTERHCKRFTVRVSGLGRKHHRNQRHRRQPQPMRRQHKRRHPHLPAHNRRVPLWIARGRTGQRRMPLRCLPAPHKGVPGVVPLHDGLDQPRKGLFAFAVRDGRVDVKEAVETIRGVFDPSGLAGRSPGHDFPDTTTFDAATVVGDDGVLGDPGDGGEARHKRGVVLVVGEGGECAPSLAVKFNSPRCQKLLECPTTCEPRFMLEIGQGRRVGEVDDAEVGVGIPLEHGVNGFAEFGGVGLVDTARVGPDEFISERPCDLAKLHELGEAGGLGVAMPAQAGSGRRGRNILEAGLAVGPTMRKDGVLDDITNGLMEGGLTEGDIVASFGVCVNADGAYPPLDVLFGNLGDLCRKDVKYGVAFDKGKFGGVNEARGDVVSNVIAERVGDVGERLFGRQRWVPGGRRGARLEGFFGWWAGFPGSEPPRKHDFLGDASASGP